MICPALRDKPGKLGLIPDMTGHRMVWGGKLLRWDGPMAYQLVGGVMAYQGDDGSRPERVSGHTGTEIRPRLPGRQQWEYCTMGASLMQRRRVG